MPGLQKRLTIVGDNAKESAGSLRGAGWPAPGTFEYQIKTTEMGHDTLNEKKKEPVHTRINERRNE